VSDRLSLRTPGLALPVDPRTLGTGIVHLGLGAFARAHLAAYTQDAVLATGDLRWGIAGVTLRSDDVVDRLAPQDCLYTLTERGPGAAPAQLVGVVREVVPGHRAPEAVVRQIAAADTAVVTLTVTEKGHHLDPATGGLAVTDADVAADAAGRPPRTPVGQLVRGLQARMQAGAGPLTVLSCDNLPANGTVLARLVDDLTGALPAAEGAPLRDWTAAHVAFPSSMVDRITPATTDADLAEVRTAWGFTDRGAVLAEPFRQWVVEDRFAGDRPAWELAGATLVSDVAPWEHCKLRLLNATHTLLALLGLLAGAETIADAVAVPALAGAGRAMMARDVVPTLAVPAGLDVAGYSEQVLARFANPALRHTTAQVASDSSQKLGPRVLSVIGERIDAGTVPRWSALVLAAWARRVATATEAELRDPLAAQLKAAVAGQQTAADVVGALFDSGLVVPAVLAGHAGLRQTVTDWYHLLATRGVAGLAEEISHG